jgi:LemA protein
MTPIVLAPAAAVLLAFVWYVATHNRLVELKQHLRESWADIDVELKRRWDLIPNLVETVKGYAQYERETLEKLMALRSTAMAVPGDAAAHAREESALMLGLKQVFALAEGYPTLKADSHYAALQKELAITEDRIAAARRFYNGNVRDLNRMREQFPSSLVAGHMEIRPAKYFELSSDAERVVPRVEI